MPSSERVALVALVLLYGLAFCSHFSIALGQLALAGLVGLLIPAARSGWASVRHDPFFWLTVAFLVYVGLRLLLALAEWPDMRPEHIEGARRLCRSAFLPVLAIAYALARLRRPLVHSVGLLGALVAGLVASALMHYDWTRLGSTPPDRMTFGLGIISHAALALATLFLASMALAACLWSWRPRSPLTVSGGGVALLLAVAALVGVVLNKTRSVWIGLAVAIVCGIGYLLWTGWRERRAGVGLSSLLLAIVVIVSAALLHEPISARWARAAPDIRSGASALVRGDIETIESGPIGDRIHWAVFGARLLADRPVLGYGPAESRYLRLERSNVPDNIDDKTTHFHNGLLDLALRLGGVGVLLFVVGVAWLLHAANAWRRHSPGPVATFVSAFIIAWILVLGLHQAGNHRFLDYNVTYMVALVGGIAHAGWLVSRRRRTAGEGPRTARA